MTGRGLAAGLAAAALLVHPATLPAQAQAQAGTRAAGADALWRAFRAPPPAARPKTWFHVVSGNMTRAGITKDFEAIAAAGIGGVMLFNVRQRIAYGPVKFNSPEFIDMMAHAAAEAKRLGLTFGFHNSDGWSSSGGPWVTPADSMKMLTYSQAVVDGGRLSTALPTPPTRQGLYRDVAVLAWPALAAEITDAALRPGLTASNGVPLAVLQDSDDLSGVEVAPAAGDGAPWIDIRFDKPVTLRAITALLGTTRDNPFRLATSDDGQRFTDRGVIEVPRLGKSEWSINATFAPTTARVFRLSAEKAFRINDLRVSNVALINDYWKRIARSSGGSSAAPLRAAEAGMAIDPASIRDLSDQIDANGRLTTTLPAGKWTVMRFGYTSTGAVNNPASKEGTGLEVDKFDTAAIDRYYAGYVGKVVAAVARQGSGKIDQLVIDSYEVGSQNWSRDFRERFRTTYGYDLTRYLPLYAGRYVGDAAQAEAVLFDARALGARLMTTEYYSHFQKLAHRDGMALVVEPYGNGPIDELDVGGRSDVPAGEFWFQRDVQHVGSPISTAHIYGKPVASTEAFTGNAGLNWGFYPGLAKTRGDEMWTVGVNEFVFHRFTHQANTHVQPGLTMGAWGSHFDRTQPWFGQAGDGWFRYMARGQEVLRAGVPVSDVALYLGDDAPAKCRERGRGKSYADQLPPGSNFDCINTEVLATRARFADGRVRLPEGTEYRAIVLEKALALRLASVERLAEAARAGVVIIGTLPTAPPGAELNTAQRERFAALVREIAARPTTHATVDWPAITARHGWTPDLLVEGQPDRRFIHRRLADADIYLVANAGDAPEALTLRPRAKGRHVERWDAVHVTRTALARAADGSVPLTLAAGEAAFVVVRDTAPATPAAAPGAPPATVMTLDRPWAVTFDAAYGLDRRLPATPLFDWKDATDPAIRHYSGKASYVQRFTAPATVAEGGRVWLDLGQVAVSAAVTLNGKPVGTAWTAPYRLDVTDAIRAGTNELRIEVASLWTNRLIGDAALPDQSGYKGSDGQDGVLMPDWYVANRPLPPGARITFTTAGRPQADAPLVPSGLIGPVTLLMDRQAGKSE